MEIIFENVDYSYDKDSKKPKKVLENINLKIEGKTIHGIIGNSGSGKTTLIQMINGLLVPDKGCVKIENYIIKKGIKLTNINELRKNVGIVFQFPEEQFFQNTVFKEISFSLGNFGYKKEYYRKKVIDVLKIVGLSENYLDKNPFELSNGEKRRIAIASILIYNPKVLVLDEPTVGLDYNNKRILIDILRQLSKKHDKTIIIVSHDIDMIYSICDNVTILVNGRILNTAPKDKIFKNTALLKQNNIKLPKIVEFTNDVFNTKGIKLGEYDNIKDLIKAVYRNV